MSTCDTPNCPGGHCKFPDCLTEAFHEIDMDGCADDTTGDVTEYGTHYALFIITTADTYTLGYGDSPVTVDLLIGGYILVTHSSGAVYLWRYNADTGGNAVAAREEFDGQDLAYQQWYNAQWPDNTN